MKTDFNVDALRLEFAGLDTKSVLSGFLERFQGRIVLASSMAAEDQVLIDMVCRITKGVNVLTLDTGRLPEETFDVIEKTRKRYGISIQILFPDSSEVEELAASGPFAFRESIAQRKKCCFVRKVQPLRRALADMDVWICGLRREQSPTREKIETIQWDETFDLIKLSPLAEWTNEQVWNYIHLNNVPYNKLHDKGFASIGCAPCTRAIAPNENVRAGRWWWESPEQKECGLHLNGKSALKQGVQNG